MSEASEQRRTDEGAAPCLGKRDGHDLVPGAAGLPWVSDEMGDVWMEPAAVWDALAGGKTVTLRCGACGALLSVGLKVRARD